MEAITRVGVVGLGTMGAGIAQVLLEGGCEVIGRDVDDAALERARTRIEAGLARRVEKGLRSEGERAAALARLTLTHRSPRARRLRARDRGDRRGDRRQA